MHIRVTRGMIDPARTDELLALLDDVVTAYQHLPGFRTYQGGINRLTGQLVAISAWDSEDAANFPRESLGEVLTRVLDVGTQLEPSEIYELVKTT